MTVNIEIMNVDETPEFGDADTTNNLNLTKVSHAEFDEDVPATGRLTVLTYNATDGDTHVDIVDTLTWTLAGTDAGDFTLSNSSVTEGGVSAIASELQREAELRGADELSPKQHIRRDGYGHGHGRQHGFQEGKGHGDER